ncbi:MAG TPA: ABC transporter ATP-binding protein [Humisphaera sp.]|jgi:lipopolysaccharide transport system ATP-binding protein|nr:ABC transporter ATP-binding protein [Humisphaera sp.]
MKDVAISIRGLSKAYTISHENIARRTFGEAVMRRIRRPLGDRRRAETFWALRDVSFDVQCGEIVGVIGRNGAGKSTLLKVLSQITEPTSGKIRVYGHVGSLLEVGTGFHAELTGRENIFLNGAILGMTRRQIRRQFDAIVDFAEVEKFLDTPVKRYSSGMYVRLAFAVAAHLEPEILVVDEVLAVGDAEFQRKCLGKMRDVARGGRTVLFVSHNMGAIRSLCQSGVVLEKGKVAFIGGVEEAVAAYRSAGTIEADPTIASLITQCHPNVQIESIHVNESPQHTLELESGAHQLDVSIQGVLHADLRMDIEAWITDSNDVTLAYFSAAHTSGVTRRCEKGTFDIRRSIALPRMLNAGQYFLGMRLTHHNVCGWMECARAVQIRAEGTPTATGQALSYSGGKGFFMLDEAVAPECEARFETARLS